MEKNDPSVNTLTGEQKLIVNSPEFELKLNELSARIVDNSQKSVNETQVAQDFSYKLKKFISNGLNVEINLTPEVNDKILGFKFEGRMDSVSHSLVIEFKHPTKLSTEKTEKQKEEAHEQIVNYLS